MTSCSIFYPPGCKEVHESLKPDDLKKRLKVLWAALTQLANAEKQGNNNNDFQGLSLHLAADHFINSDDKDVRLLIGCCLIEMFKIYCPSNPFVSLCDENELIATVLTFLYRTACQLQQVKSKNDVSYEKLSYFCQSLIQTDLIMVCHDNPAGKAVCHEFFRFLFTIVRSVDTWSWEATPEASIACLVEAAAKVVNEEIELVGSETINYVLEFLIQPKKMQEPRCNQLAVQFLQAGVNHLESPIHQTLQEMLILSSADSPMQQQQQQQKGIKEDLVFLLIYELHKLDHAFVNPVLPMMKMKLLSKSERERKRACRVMAKLFGEATGSLMERQPDLWQAYLGRFVDVSVEVRTICVSSVPQLLRANPELRDSLLALLRGRSMDPEEAIRNAVITLVADMAKQQLESLPEDFLSILVDRSRDKDQGVRRTALTNLASIYKAYITDSNLIRSGNKAVWTRLAQCANAIMHMYFQETNWDRIAVERHFKASLVPYNLSAKDRMRALLRCFCSFSNASTKALVEMLKTQYHVTQLTGAILEIISNEPEQLSPQSESVLMTKLRSLSSYFQQADRANEHLRRFFNLLQREKSMRQQLTKLLSKDCPCAKAAELLRSLLASSDKTVNTTSKKAKEWERVTNYRITVKTLLERVGPVLFDRESVTSLVNLLISGREDSANILPGEACAVTQYKGLLLLKMLSFYFPHTVDLDDTFDYLVECLGDEAIDVDTSEVCLSLLLNLIPLFNEDRQEAVDSLVPCLRRLCDSVKSSATVSSLAKLAAKCLTALQASGLAPQVVKEFDSIVADAGKLSYSSQLCVPRLDALGQILKRNALHYQSKVASLVTKRLLSFIMQPDAGKPSAPAAAGSRKSAVQPAAKLSQWCPTESLSHLTRVKLASIRCLCHYLIGLASASNAAASASTASALVDCVGDDSKTIFDLLYRIILHDGDPAADGSTKGVTEAGELAQMRACTAKAMLRICQRQPLLQLLDCDKFQTLALIICDPCKEVRQCVLDKLHRGLTKFRLPLQFMAMFAYVTEAADDKDFQQLARQYYARCVSVRRELLAKQSVIANDKVRFFSVLPDYTLPYAVHLLANDPHLESPKDAKQVARLKSGLRFLLEPLIAKGENFGFLRRMLEKMRQACDAQRPDDELANRKLHAVADLALGLIVTKSANFSISSYPIEPQLPKRLYQFPASREVNASPEFANLPAGLQFSPPKNPTAVKQGLIPKDRIRPGKRTAGQAAIDRSPSPTLVKSTPATKVKSAASGAAAPSTMSKAAVAASSTLPSPSPSKSPSKSPMAGAKQAAHNGRSPAVAPVKADDKPKTKSSKSSPASARAPVASRGRGAVRGRGRRSMAAASSSSSSSSSSDSESSPEKPDELPAARSKTALSVKSKEAPAAKSKEAPAAKSKEAPAAKSKEAPVAKSKEAPAAKSKEAPAAKSKEAPAAKSKEAPAAKSKEAPAAKSKEAPAAKSKEAAAAKSKEAPADRTKKAAKSIAVAAAKSKVTPITSQENRKRRAVAPATTEESSESESADSPAPAKKSRRVGLSARVVASPSTISTTATPGSSADSGADSGRPRRAAKLRSIEALSRGAS